MANPTITLTIQLTERPDAATMVYDGLHEALYALCEAGAINDDDDNGWFYKEVRRG